MGKNLISQEQEDLIAHLEQDVQQAFQNVVDNDQFWCRTLVRAVFSYFEAHGFVIRSATMKLLKPDRNRSLPPLRRGGRGGEMEARTQHVNHA